MTALMQDQDWYTDALCAEIGGDEWFPEKGGSTREAKAVCNGTATRPACPVRDQCLAFALDHDERFGIYGGLSERERRKLKKTGTTPNDTTATPVQEPTMTTTNEQPAPRSYGQTHIGATGHRPIPTDLTPRPKTPAAPRPTGLDWGKHTAPDTAPANPAPAPGLRCRWCRLATSAQDLIDDVCGVCRDDVATQFSPPTVGGVNATLTAVLHSGDTGPKDTPEATFLSVAGDPCAPDQEETDAPDDVEEEWEHVEELPPYILDIAILMRDTEGHADPGVRTARKVVANALVGLNKALTMVPTAPAPAAVPQRPAATTAPRGPRVDVDQIVRLYEIGCTINAISKQLGHSKNTIRHHLIDRGVELRDDRKTHSGGHNRIEAYPDELVADVRRLYLDEQKSQIQVAAALGITAKVVQCVMAKHEIPARPAGRSTSPQTRPGHNGAHAIKARLDALGYTAAQVRAWATDQGLSCPSRGSIPNHLVDQYEAAHTATSQNQENPS